MLDRETLDRIYGLWREVDEIINKHFTIVDDMGLGGLGIEPIYGGPGGI